MWPQPAPAVGAPRMVAAWRSCSMAANNSLDEALLASTSTISGPRQSGGEGGKREAAETVSDQGRSCGPASGSATRPPAYSVPVTTAEQAIGCPRQSGARSQGLAASPLDWVRAAS